MYNKQIKSWLPESIQLDQGLDSDLAIRLHKAGQNDAGNPCAIAPHALLGIVIIPGIELGNNLPARISGKALL